MKKDQLFRVFDFIITPNKSVIYNEESLVDVQKEIILGGEDFTLQLQEGEKTKDIVSLKEIMAIDGRFIISTRRNKVKKISIIFADRTDIQKWIDLVHEFCCFKTLDDPQIKLLNIWEANMVKLTYYVNKTN